MKQGMDVYKHIMDSPIGTLRLYATEDHLVGLLMEKEKESGIQKRFENAILQNNKILEWAVHELHLYFLGKQMHFAVPMALWGTSFQQAVWRELQSIPAGELRSYGEHAARLAYPNAMRAVGAAVGSNPISIFVPCHRVIGKTGHLTGYAGGLETKMWLLRHEGHEIRNNKIQRSQHGHW